MVAKRKETRRLEVFVDADGFDHTRTYNAIALITQETNNQDVVYVEVIIDTNNKILIPLDQCRISL